MQTRIETGPQVTCTRNLVMTGHMITEICVQTDTQTDRQTATLIIILCTNARSLIYH